MDSRNKVNLGIRYVIYFQVFTLILSFVIFSCDRKGLLSEIPDPFDLILVLSCVSLIYGASLICPFFLNIGTIKNKAWMKGASLILLSLTMSYYSIYFITRLFV